MKVNAADIFEATFAPGQTEDLTPEARRIIGRRFRWTATWRVDEGFPYAGERRMELGRVDHEATGVFWVPLCDLIDLVHMGVDPEARIYRLLEQG